MYEYDSMEISDCSQSMRNSKSYLNRYTTRSSEVLTVLVELYEMTYCSAPDGFYSEDDGYFFDKVSKGQLSNFKMSFWRLQTSQRIFSRISALASKTRSNQKSSTIRESK